MSASETSWEAVARPCIYRRAFRADRIDRREMLQGRLLARRGILRQTRLLDNGGAYMSVNLDGVFLDSALGVSVMKHWADGAGHHPTSDRSRHRGVC
jgi:hypothetical protein